MIKQWDLSIGQRLALGFGVLMIIVAGVFVLVAQWHAESARASAVYSERIVPVVDGIGTLERRIARTAIDLRSLFLNPDGAAVTAFRARIAGARAALDELRAAAVDGDVRRSVDEIAVAAESYLARAEDFSQGDLNAGLASSDETELRDLREAVLGLTRALDVAQAAAATAALDDIAAMRERTSEGLTVLAVVTLGLLAVLAWLTARTIAHPTRSLLATANALAAGEWQPALALAPTNTGGAPSSRNEMLRLRDAFGAAAVAIEGRERRLKGNAQIAQAVASTLNRDDLCRTALERVIEHVGAEVGVLYVTNGDSSRLVPAAAYALGGDLAQVELGEGVPGQAARERRRVLVTDVPADSGFDVRFGYDRSPPKALAAVPLTFGATLHGVLLVGSLRNFDADALAFLDSAATKLSIGLQNVAAYEETQRLLAEVRESNERIQGQNEELQAQNEEIQAQSEELQAQQEEIQVQNEELLQQGEELRARVAELAEADARKNQFLGVLAHELRNPMTPIANCVHILKRTEPGSDGARRAQAVIERQVMHLVRLVDDLLDVTRISEGKIALQRQPLDLVEIVHASAEDMAATYEQAGVRLELDVPAEPVCVNGDRTRLAQVLGNLLNNSMKFSDKGNVKVEVRVDRGSRQAVLRVIDDGIGLSEELLPNLFQPFAQGAPDLARAKGGLGLGLSLVKALVTLHEGEIGAHSDGPGRGAQFTVRLPLAARAVAREPLPPAPRTQRPSELRRVLVIEDNVDAATSLREVLELDGYEVTVAHSGLDGLTLAADLGPDVVLCDIGLPGLDGYQVARQLRADPRTRSVILIALTGYASALDKDSARAAGFDLHLAKPLRVTSFASTLAKLHEAKA